MAVLLALFFCSCSGGGAGGGGDGGSDTSGSGSAGAGSSKCAQSISVQQDTEKEENCTTIAFFTGLQENERLKSIAKLTGEAPLPAWMIR
jgi:hypothetical protein